MENNGRKKIILNSLNHLVDQGALRVCAFVIMPNHIHLIWKPLSNENVKNIQLSFMRFTAQQILFHLQDSKSIHIEKFLVDKKDRKFQIWQRNPLAVHSYSKEVIEQKLDYIHNNPVQGKWMLAQSPTEYRYSSACFYDGNYTAFKFLSHYVDEI